MKVLRWGGLAVSVLVVFGLGLYLAFPALAAALLERALVGYGLTLTELQITRPGLTHWRVNRAQVAGLGYALKVVDLDVAYTWDSLKSGRATQITLAEIGAEIDEAGGAGDVEIGALLLQVPEQIESLWRELPADGLRVQNFSLRSPVFADSTLVDGELSGELELSPELLTIQATASDFRLSFRMQREGELALELSNAESFARLQAQPDITGTAAVEWTFADLAQVSGSAPFAIDHQGWELGSGLAVGVTLHEAYELDAQVQITAVRGGWDENADELLRATVGWQGKFVQDDTRVAGEGQAELALGGSEVLIEVSPGSKFVSPALGTDDIVISGLTVVLPDATTLRADLTNVRVDVQTAALELTADTLEGFDITLHPEVTIKLEDVRVDAASATMAFTAQYPELQLHADGRAQVKFATATWNLETQLQQVLSAGLRQRALDEDAPEYDIDAGTITTALSIRGQGSDAYAGDGTVTLAGLTGHYDDVTAAGIAGLIEVQFNERQWRASANRLAVAGIDVGFPVTDLSAGMSANAEAVNLIDVRGTTLGGVLQVDTLRYDIAAEQSHFLVQATGVQLNQVLALEGDTLTGEAILDGQLPVRVLGSDVSVAAGEFKARPPGGVLRYGGATEAAQSLEQTGVGFAIGALADFQFEVLNVKVDYQANGDLLLGVRLEGHNDNFEAGRPIHYNLNVTENIPVLLESLQLSDEVGRRLEQRLLD